MKTYTFSRIIMMISIISLASPYKDRVFAQEPLSIIWQKAVGGTKHDEIRHLINTPDGGCVFTGFTNSADKDITINKGDDDLLVAKMDPLGNIEWLKTYGGTGQEWGRHIQMTADGGYIVAGHATTLSDLYDVTGNHGGFDYWVVKLSSKGDLQWQKTLGGSILDLGYSVKQTPDGGYIVCGGARSSDGNIEGKTGNDSDYWLVRLDANGNILWQRLIGGSNHEEGSSVELTSDGGFILSGLSASNDEHASGNHGGNDAFIVKTDSLGNVQWTGSYGGSGEDVARVAIQTADGGYIFCAYTGSDDGDVTNKYGGQDAWVVKLDSVGHIQWQRALGGSQFEFTFSIEETRDRNGYLVSGNSASNNGLVSGNHGLYDCWIMELNLIGNLVWQKSLGGSKDDFGRTVTQTLTGDYLVAGYFNSSDGDVIEKHGGTDGWVVKLSGDCFNQPFYQDADEDGYGNAAASLLSCGFPSGYSLSSTDCNDSSNTVFPGAAEACNNADDDCDNQVDEGVQSTYYRDADDDTYGDPASIIMACAEIPSGYVSNSTDCNDASAAIGLHATEVCNSVDDNCNGMTDEAMKAYDYTDNTSGIPLSLSINTSATNLELVNGAVTTTVCPTGFSAKKFATDPSYSTSLPAIQFTLTVTDGYQIEATSFSADLRRATNGPSKVRFAYSINGGSTWIDQGTDHLLDNSLCGITTTFSWDFADFTTTLPITFRIYGFGAASTAGVFQVLNVNLNGTVCLQFDEDHDGFITSVDCNDANPAIHPNATEICNGVDDNCDNQSDEGVTLSFYADADNDTYGNPNISIIACAAEAGYVSNNTDCDDNNSEVNPNATEVCNTLDDNCNTETDEGVISKFYSDADNDTYGNPAEMVLACTKPAGYVSNDADCNDGPSGSAIHPGAQEVCNNADDDCDGITDEAVLIYQYTDNIAGVPFSVSVNAAGTALKKVNGAGAASKCETGYHAKKFTNAATFSTSLPAIEFTVLPNSGYTIEAVSFSAGIRRNGGGPVNVRFAYSTDAGNTWIDQGLNHTVLNADCGIMTDYSWDFADFSITQPLKFRIYGFSASSGTGILQLLNVNLNGTVCIVATDADDDGYDSTADCNDGNPLIYPGATEVCNALDDDCDEVIDENSITATITPLSSLDICLTGSVILQANDGLGYLYQWKKNNEDIPAATNQNYEATAAGEYQVFVTDINNCSNVSETETVSNTCKTTEEEGAITDDTFELYPNPTDGKFAIQLSAGFTHKVLEGISGKIKDEENVTAVIRIVNIMGQIIYSESIPIINGQLQKEITLAASLANGLYMVNVMVNAKSYDSHGHHGFRQNNQWTGQILYQK